MVGGIVREALKGVGNARATLALRGPPVMNARQAIGERRVRPVPAAPPPPATITVPARMAKRATAPVAAAGIGRQMIAPNARKDMKK